MSRAPTVAARMLRIVTTDGFNHLLEITEDLTTDFLNVLF